MIERISTHGATPVQPVVISKKILYVDRSTKKIFTLSFNYEVDGYEPIEITAVADHITGTGIAAGQIAFQRRPDPRCYFVLESGTLVTLTYFDKEKVIGFTRLVTDGFFESVAVIPDSVSKEDQVWVTVRRTINGVTKRFVEMFENNAEFTDRSWKNLQTDCAVVYKGVAVAVITGLTHLNGAIVDIIADGEFKGQQVVSGGQITLEEAATEVEVGLHYDSEGETMRPALQGQVIEGLPRTWGKVFARLFETRGGKINGQELQYAVGELGVMELFTGDKDVTDQGWDTEGRITFLQDKPLPMTLLAIFGELILGDHS